MEIWLFILCISAVFSLYESSREKMSIKQMIPAGIKNEYQFLNAQTLYQAHEIGHAKMERTDLSEEIRTLTWEIWKEKKKGILCHQNLFNSAVCLLPFDDCKIFELQMIEILNPGQDANDKADHSMVHLQFEHQHRIIDVILESFSGQIGGHQFYAEGSEERMYEAYIQTGRHFAYEPTQNKSGFNNTVSYSLAFAKIQDLHSRLSALLHHKLIDCHFYAKRLYDLFK